VKKYLVGAMNRKVTSALQSQLVYKALTSSLTHDVIAFHFYRWGNRGNLARGQLL